jgi:hypothetical protein
VFSHATFVASITAVRKYIPPALYLLLDQAGEIQDGVVTMECRMDSIS